MKLISSLSTAPGARAQIFASSFVTAMILVTTLFTGASSRAQVETWNPGATGTTGVDNFTNGAAWSPAVAYSGSTAPLFNGSGFKLMITNNGTGLLGGTDVCVYAGSPGGDPAWTNLVGDLAIGGFASITSGANGGNSNAFIMNGGSLVLAEASAGNNGFCMGSGSTASGQSFANKNYFILNDGVFASTNCGGDNLMGMPENSVSTANFNGGTAWFSTLRMGGRGTGTVNVNGGTVNFVTNNVASRTGLVPSGSLGIGWGIFTNYTGANGTFNLLSGTVNATNRVSSTNTIYLGGLARTAKLTISGGTLNANGISFSFVNVSNNNAYDGATLTVSGGNVNLGAAGIFRSDGLARAGYQNLATVLSGGTFSTLFGQSWTWVGNSLTNVNLNGTVTFAPAAGTTITLGAGGNISGSGGISSAGPGTLILANTNLYSGSTLVSGSTLQLINGGWVTNSSAIVVAGGATLDVSGLATTPVLTSLQTLGNSTATATINGNINTGSGTVSLVYGAGTPAFSITGGALTLSPASVFTVNNTGSALGLGSYLILSAGAGGSVTGTAPAAHVTVTGGGVAANTSATLSISGGQLYLLVASAPPAILGQSPVTYANPFTLFAGASPTFSVAADAQPDTYFWYTNGVLNRAATGASFNWASVPAGSLSVYCVASNSLGTAASQTWQATVIAAPTAAFPQAVLGDSPISYWRMNDADDGLSDGNPGAICHDYLGGNDGIYTNAVLGQPGYSAITDPAQTSALFGTYLNVTSLADQIQGINLAATNGVNAEFTVEALVALTNNTGGGIVAKGFGNGGEEFCLDTGGGSGSSHFFRFFVRNSSNAAFNATSPFAPRTNGIVWYHLVGVCDEAGGVLSLYVNGALAGSGSIPVQSGIAANDAWPLTIGSRSASKTSGNTAQSFGNIDDVAVYNYALSAAQVAAHYSAAGFPPTFTQISSTNFNLYAGGSASWYVATAGGQPMYYQWYSNNVAVSGATATNYLLGNAQLPGAVQNYYCVASNAVSVATSAVVTVSILTSPSAPYPAGVLAAGPIGYWRLNEANVDGVNNGLAANDYWGGHNGAYTNTVLGRPGYASASTPSTDPATTSAQFGYDAAADCDAYGIPGIDFTTPTNSNAGFTVEAWVNAFTQGKDAGIVSKGYGGAEQFNLDTGSDAIASHGYRFFVRDASGATHTASSSVTPNGSWHHLVGVCDEANGLVTLYINGQVAASATITPGAGILSSARQMLIGSRPSGSATANDDQFNGFINDVAVYNYALSASQVLNQYVAAGEPPLATVVPTNYIYANGNDTIVLPMSLIGTPPLYYQWTDLAAGTNVATGTSAGNQLDATLTVPNVPASWNGDMLQLTVTNAYGSTNLTVFLSVYSNVQFVNDLPATVSAVSGRPFAYNVAVNGQPPYGFTWYSNSVPVSGQTNSSLGFTTGSPGTYTFQVIVTNIFGQASSTLSTLTVFPQLTNAYASAILQYQPVGYWPLHEVEPSVPGNVEINYGSLGMLGDAYYPDWVQSYNAFNRNYPGPLAADSDPAVYFTEKSSNAGDITNGVYVPHHSPQATLNPPFSVECWTLPTSATLQGDIWSQSGYEGLNAGGSGNGDGSVAGMRLYWNAPGFVIYSYYNGSTLHNVFGTITAAAGAWHHVVVTCDTATNMTFYLDGVLQKTVPAVGLYAPDYWTPFEVGQGRGNTRAFAKGAVDEVAVYTNVLAAGDVTQHYTDATNVAPATSYFSDVTNNGPVIYLRMDNGGYYPPDVSTWPGVTNYGNYGLNGVYTPGTLPGLLPGPATPAGQPFGGIAATRVAALSGVSSYADVGYSPAYNPTGTVPFSVTAMFRGDPVDNRSQTIVGHTTSSWRLWMNTSGKVQWQIGGKTLGSSGVYNDGGWHHVVAVYTPAADPGLTGTNLLYIDGALDSSLSTVATNGITPGSTADVMIGSDPQYTNNPVGVGQQWSGQICEVALFTNALTAAQAQSLYGSGQVAPYITGQPVTGRSVLGGAGTYIYFGVLARGSGPLAYQWFFNNTPAYAGATRLTDDPAHYASSSTLQVTVTNLAAADSGYYYAVITNSFGSVTSALASLTVNVSTALSVSSPSGSGPMQIVWSFGGTLQSSTNAAGPYNDVTGATSPYSAPLTNSQQFFRVRLQ